MSKPVIGVLVMAYGTPERPEDLLPYYTDIRRGRAPTPEQLVELRARYEAIGGKSNLNEITRAQAAGIDRYLNGGCDEVDYRVYVANKHWHPRIPAVVQQMSADGITKAVGIVMAPQGSQMSSETYHEIVRKSLAELPEAERFEYDGVFSWHLEPGYIAAEAEKVRDAVTRFPETTPDKLAVAFTCHSLPQRVLALNDPYPAHLREIGEAVAREVGLGNVHFAFQSAGRTPEPWLGPDVREKVAELAAQGEKSVLVCSVGFISDHLEVLYDLDIELQREADKLGLHFGRMGMLNDDPLLVEALANVVRRHALGGSR